MDINKIIENFNKLKKKADKLKNIKIYQDNQIYK